MKNKWINACLMVATFCGVFSSAHAQSEDVVVPKKMTWDLQTVRSSLTAGLPDGEAVSLRGSWLLPRGDSLQVELLDEHRFGDHGGVAAAAYTAVLSPDWYGTGTLVFGHGGPNWANVRVDGQLSRKWLAQKQLITSVAAYRAAFDADRSDTGLRLAATWYFAWPAVLEGGVILNRSQPGSVHSYMPFAAVTIGQEGSQYLSLRATDGTEAYQALGSAAELVNFRSRSVTATWRYWMAPNWGFNALAEHYRNPTYARSTFGVGLFAAW